MTDQHDPAAPTPEAQPVTPDGQPLASDAAGSTAEAPAPEAPPFVDADDTHDDADGAQGASEPSAPSGEFDQLGETLAKAATDTAYATVGLVSLVSDKAKEFYEEQRRQYVAAHPEAADAPGADTFLAQLRGHVDRLVEDLGRGFRDLADRGRAASRPDAPEVTDGGPAEHAAEGPVDGESYGETPPRASDEKPPVDL